MFMWDRSKSISGMLLLTALCLLLSACGSQPLRENQIAEFQRERAQQARVDTLNQQLAMRSLAEDPLVSRGSNAYLLGAGDLVEFTVLGVPELSREARIDGNGTITLPLIGSVLVEGKTVDEASKLVAERYGESYLQAPQVSLIIREYRSMRITVLGAVGQPQVYNVQQRVSVLVALAMAGGVTSNAGDALYVRDQVVDPETGERSRRSLVINLDDIMRGEAEIPDIILGDGAVINVPEGGVVYVEGEVGQPGLYEIRKGTTVLKTIAQAGGMRFVANESAIQVLRVQPDGRGYEPLHRVNYSQVKQNPGADIELRDGDVVVVGKDPIKYALRGAMTITREILGILWPLDAIANNN